MDASNKTTFEEYAAKEWIVTNGLGGYASQTLSGALTRRYHGLLVASLNPPTDRKVLVAKTEETLIDGEERIELGTNIFGEVVAPQGYKLLKKFERTPFPAYHFQVKEMKLVKTIFMCYGQNTTVVVFENTGKETLHLKSNILLNHRDYHGNTFENEYLNFYTEASEAQPLVTYAHYQSPPLFTHHNGKFVSDPNWYKNFHYPREAERGLLAQEDLFSIGFVHFSLDPGQSGYLLFTTEALHQKPDIEKLKKAEAQRIKKLKTSHHEFLNDLLVSGDQFLVKRKATNSHTLIAGYHWFTDWGRDSMIALRGLAIDSNKPRVVESIVKTFLAYLDKGMLPNRFPDAPQDDVEYNTVDATLWLFVVLYEYYQKFDNKTFIKKCFDALGQIIDAYKNGTRYQIHETPEGFIFAGEGIAQLTWMDARVGDYVVTPRHGCPVEIQALWYNALKIYQFFAEELKLDNKSLENTADSLIKFEKHFIKEFWNEKGYLNDVVMPWQNVDSALRCNQIYAVSLPFSPLKKPEQKAVVKSVEEHLLTPYGLRTLAPDHPDFKTEYSGDVWKRDKAYHQGTVWPFLLSEYVEAKLKTAGNTPKNKKALSALIKPLEQHFYTDNCLHGVSEIFDGLHPTTGKGTIQQAWSVAALIRILSKTIED